jgi:hypothetical protein
MSDKPQFTREQKDWICFCIDESCVYLKEKIALDKKIVMNVIFHELGIAKEELKKNLYDEFYDKSEESLPF